MNWNIEILTNTVKKIRINKKISAENNFFCFSLHWIITIIRTNTNIVINANQPISSMDIST